MAWSNWFAGAIAARADTWEGWGHAMSTEIAPQVRSAVDAYIDEIERWRRWRIEQLTAPDGWLTLIGLEWLRPGANRIGAAPANDIVLGAGPAHLGTITLTADGHASIRLTPDVDAHIDGSDGTEAALIDDAQGGGRPTIVRFGTASLSLIDRDGRKGVRVKESNAVTRMHFLGLDYFPINPSWRIEATWVPADEPQTLAIPSTLGTVRERPVLGRAVFTREGHTYALSAAGAAGDRISFVIADATSGRETYGGARFLTPDLTEDGRMVLDFNKATNPPCAFTPYATCPLAPAENRLDMPITAGEMTYRGAAH
jgi:uncharacterized protein (DUF1684 family)